MPFDHTTLFLMSEFTSSICPYMEFFFSFLSLFGILGTRSSMPSKYASVNLSCIPFGLKVIEYLSHNIRKQLYLDLEENPRGLDLWQYSLVFPQEGRWVDCSFFIPSRRCCRNCHFFAGGTCGIHTQSNILILPYTMCN